MYVVCVCRFESIYKGSKNTASDKALNKATTIPLSFVQLYSIIYRNEMPYIVQCSEAFAFTYTCVRACVWVSVSLISMCQKAHASHRWGLWLCATGSSHFPLSSFTHSAMSSTSPMLYVLHKTAHIPSSPCCVCEPASVRLFALNICMWPDVSIHVFVEHDVMFNICLFCMRLVVGLVSFTS